MCLYTNKKEPFIADRDIKVFKHLKGFSGNFARTPYQGTRVKLDSDLVPEERTTDISSCGEINRGAIHACLWPNFSISTECVEAYIPKGTKYWMGIDNATVCAKKLRLTDKRIKEGDNVTMDPILAQQSYDNAPQNKGIKIGSFLVHGQFVSPTVAAGAPKSEIKGIVVGFYKDRPLIADILNVKDDISFDTKYDSCLDRHVSSGSEAVKDMAGEKHMEAWKKHMEKLSPSEISRFEVYTNTRMLGEDHYVPALGEMEEMWRNILYIAAACSLAHIVCPLTPGVWFWTSTEGSEGRCWCSYLYSDGPTRDWDVKCYRLSVVSFVPSAN